MTDVENVYMHKNGRLMAYIKETQQVVSYPRVIMENYLGRKLDADEEVHHKDGNPLNNDIDNLEVLTKEEHLRLHAEENKKYFDKAMICPVCGNEFLWTDKQQSEFYRNVRRRNHRYKYQSMSAPVCSKRCAGKYGKMVQEQNGVEVSRNKRKLTDDDIKYIRNNYIPRDREFGERALARKFNVDHSVIDLILHNKTYKNVV